MNKKGFTLVELLAVLVVLGIVVGITIPSINGIMKNSKQKSEEAFIETIKDAMEVYLSGTEKSSLSYTTCFKDSNVEYARISFNAVINSTYKPINKGSLFNPSNETSCSANVADTDFVTIYRNNNYVYNYVISKGKFGCFDNVKKDASGKLTKDKINYISSLNDPGNFVCS